MSSYVDQDCKLHGKTRFRVRIQVSGSRIGKKRTECLKCVAGRVSKHYHENRDQYSRNRSRVHGINPHPARRRARINGRKLKEEVLAKYSKDHIPLCSKCGEKEIQFLCLDHVKNDGSVHRKTLSKGGLSIYRWAKKNNYPDELQTLCNNCNAIKHNELIASGSKAAQWRRRTKMKVLRAYCSDDRPRCEKCDMEDVRALTIDHVNGGGAEHMREIGGSNRFYLWLVKNQFPVGFRILCFNHNMTHRPVTSPPREGPRGPRS